MVVDAVCAGSSDARISRMRYWLPCVAATPASIPASASLTRSWIASLGSWSFDMSLVLVAGDTIARDSLGAGARGGEPPC